MGHIVVGVDGSHGSERALRWAVHEARLHALELQVLSIYTTGAYAGQFGTSDRELAQRRVDEVTARHRPLLDSVPWSATLAESGSATEGLLDAAWDAVLLVVGSRGREGFDRLTIGSTSYRVAAHGSVPVAVVPERAPHVDGSRGVLVGVDGSAASGRALRWALGETAERGGTVTVVHSYTLPADFSTYAVINKPLHDEVRADAHRRAADVLDGVVAAADVPADVTLDAQVVLGPAAGVLLDHQGEDLLVVGTRGRNALGRTLFGSVSQQVLHHATGPVVVVP